RTAEFGVPGDQRDALVAAVLDGTKTATSEPLDGYRRHDLDPGDELGNYEVVVDSLNQPVALIRINSVATVPLADVDQAHAARDGRGFTTAAQWRTAHEEFWSSDDFRANLGEPTLELGDDTPIVLLGFRTYRPGDVVAGHVVDFSDVPGA
ncbi:MAG: ASCH domain-containing protein, partial [Propionibacterium sp.]|nr:ASCH domain-containing protein [Propionibacterium sp.]